MSILRNGHVALSSLRVKRPMIGGRGLFKLSSIEQGEGLEWLGLEGEGWQQGS